VVIKDFLRGKVLQTKIVGGMDKKRVSVYLETLGFLVTPEGVKPPTF
jgi:hypothetical protein